MKRIRFTEEQDYCSAAGTANQRRRFGYHRLFILLGNKVSRQASTAFIGSTAKKG